MSVTLRKLVVGCGALAALLGVYLLYTHVNRMPPLAAELARKAPAPTVDVNTGPPGDVGTIAGVGIDRVEQTEFLHRNERHDVDRIFGFEQLLHKEGSQWEITNPYMKLFLPTFRCIVTANRGKVQVQTVFSRPMANDAQFSGNVLIHILPIEPNSPLECFIHLDDVTFQAARSLFSSGGAVRFFARGGQATGTGMELLYNEGRSRLELFRIFKLGNMRFRSAALGSVADLTPRTRPERDAPSVAPPPAPAGTTVPPEDRYECLLRRHVAIETPDRVIAARDELAIHNLIWSNAKSRDALAKPAPAPNDTNAAPYPGPNALDTSASSHAALSSIPPESFDTVVTCEGGLEVTLVDPGQKPPGRGQKPEATAQDSTDNAPSSALRSPSSAGPDRQRTTAQRIDFDALTRDTTLAGPVAMAFLLDPNGLTEVKAPARGSPPRGAGTPPQAVPMTVTAEKAVRFLAAANRVLFEGDCKATLLRSEPNVTYEYTLTAPRLVLDVASDPNSHKQKELAVAARQLATDGGPALLHIWRRASDKVLGETELHAAQLQYETEPFASASPGVMPARGAQFTALGPGAIWIRNDEMVNRQADPNQFSLGRPCVARITNFDTLKYFTATNRIVADNEAQQLLLDYFPLVDGKYSGQHTRTVAGHLEASLQEVTKGHLELATLTATKGIYYEDETKKVSFSGASLSYDYSQSLVAIRGDAQQPCLLNGARVNHIDLNLKTGRLQAEPAGGVIQVQR